MGFQSVTPLLAVTAQWYECLGPLARTTQSKKKLSIQGPFQRCITFVQTGPESHSPYTSQSMLPVKKPLTIFGSNVICLNPPPHPPPPSPSLFDPLHSCFPIVSSLLRFCWKWRLMGEGGEEAISAQETRSRSPLGISHWILSRSRPAGMHWRPQSERCHLYPCRQVRERVALKVGR